MMENTSHRVLWKYTRYSKSQKGNQKKIKIIKYVLIGTTCTYYTSTGSKTKSTVEPGSIEVKGAYSLYTLKPSSGDVRHHSVQPSRGTYSILKGYDSRYIGHGLNMPVVVV